VDAPAGHYDKSVSDGYWVMLKPLSPGRHDIHFGGTFFEGEPFEFTMDITYHVNVAPKGQFRAAVVAPARAAAISPGASPFAFENVLEDQRGGIVLTYAGYDGCDERPRDAVSGSICLGDAQGSVGGVII
jgi:hypothetical protein